MAPPYAGKRVEGETAGVGVKQPVRVAIAAEVVEGAGPHTAGSPVVAPDICSGVGPFQPVTQGRRGTRASPAADAQRVGVDLAANSSSAWVCAAPGPSAISGLATASKSPASPPHILTAAPTAFWFDVPPTIAKLPAGLSATYSPVRWR